MPKLTDRIEGRLNELGKSARRASLEGGLTQDAIRNILREKSKNPRRDTLEGIARGLEWNLDDLLQNKNSDSIDRSKTPIQSVPIISWIDAESLLTLKPKYCILEKAKVYVPTVYRRNTLVALPVLNYFKERVAPEGSLIIVDYYEKNLISNGYFVVRHKGNTFFRKFENKPRRLEPDCSYPCKTIFINQKIDVVGRVVQITNNLV